MGELEVVQELVQLGRDKTTTVPNAYVAETLQRVFFGGKKPQSNSAMQPNQGFAGPTNSGCYDVLQ